MQVLCIAWVDKFIDIYAIKHRYLLSRGRLATSCFRIKSLVYGIHQGWTSLICSLMMSDIYNTVAWGVVMFFSTKSDI